MTFAVQLTPKGHLEFGAEPGAPLLPDALTATPDDGEIAVTEPDVPTLETLCLDAPPMTGAEYLTRNSSHRRASGLSFGEVSARRIPS